MKRQTRFKDLILNYDCGLLIQIPCWGDEINLDEYTYPQLVQLRKQLDYN